jgi:hypothetical protein
MAYRFTNTDKWNDAWFYELDLRQKAVFLYLCDTCDIAGFYEINYKRMAQDIGMSHADVKGALKGLHSRIIYSTDGKYLFLRNFIKHQKNLPLNGNNNAHKGIIKLLSERLQLFNFQSIEEYGTSPKLGASEGLASPIGNSNGNGNGNGDNRGGTGGKEGEKGGENETQPDETQPDESKSAFDNWGGWVAEKAPYCFKNMKQLTEKEFEKLKEGYTSEQMANVILQIENRKDLRKRYSNLYRTMLNWLKNETGKK